MTTFPLFHLPLVAMEHVLCMMCPIDLINLSWLSFRVDRTVASFSRTKPKFRVVLSFTQKPRLLIDVGTEYAGYGWTPKELETDSETYSKYPTKYLMDAYDYIKEVLKCQFQIVVFDLSSYPSQNELITDWLRSQNQSIATMEISNSGKETDDDLKYLMSKITVTDKLILATRKYKDDFQMEIPTNSYETLIENSGFIDFEQLLRLKNSCITLHQSRLTDQELNKFLKSWMACESHLMLETFEINVSGPEAMEVIMDLPHEETADPNVVESFGKKFDNPVVENWFDIKRCDGKVATVGLGFRYTTKLRF
uniref:FBA_2 domain-containing protein n=1 Tax=Caenorhabditis tropicalis TaxID=1561998 RepID=A0A1I7TUN9_9PELO